MFGVFTLYTKWGSRPHKLTTENIVNLFNFSQRKNIIQDAEGREL